MGALKRSRAAPFFAVRCCTDRVLKRYKVSARETKNSGINTYLYGPNGTSATIVAKRRSASEQEIYVNAKRTCRIPENGLSVLVLRPTDD